jgi:hypothetical protein
MDLAESPVLILFQIGNEVLQILTSYSSLWLGFRRFLNEIDRPFNAGVQAQADRKKLGTLAISAYRSSPN